VRSLPRVPPPIPRRTSATRRVHARLVFAIGMAALPLALAVAACQSRSDGATPSGDPQKCTRIGQTCEYSPNKLGSCVIRDNCSQDCLVCQSQH
jgi:hypothetical protein